PGDMYVLHPFTVHAADEHRGHTPRFMAQAPIMLTSPVEPGASTPLASVFD
ncbi:MAG: protein involved in biosynthesis of mitomycin antibiotics/polyketide fumonisin, partial [Mycobacterium sp.]|nr:protein involved in biosynthesis of mitomycin antibiotics/polyketide fumonisin [Mycobacterium sp.]